jgi:hypothetical protein
MRLTTFPYKKTRKLSKIARVVCKGLGNIGTPE